MVLCIVSLKDVDRHPAADRIPNAVFLTAIPSIFQDVYGFSVGIASLHYIPLGIGMYGGAVILAKVMDRSYAALKEKAGGVGKPEFRLREAAFNDPPAIVPHLHQAHCSIFQRPWYPVPSCSQQVFSLQAGLQMQKPTGSVLTLYVVTFLSLSQPFQASNVASQGLFMAGAGILISSLATQSYVIDSYGIHSASSLAAVGTLRSLAGFGFPLFAPAMYKSLGYGKGDTVLFSVAVAIGCPA